MTYRGKTQSLGKKESFKSLSDYIVDLSILQSIREDYCSYAIFFHGFDYDNTGSCVNKQTILIGPSCAAKTNMKVEAVEYENEEPTKLYLS